MDVLTWNDLSDDWPANPLYCLVVCLGNSLHCMQGHNIREDAFADT